MKKLLLVLVGMFALQAHAGVIIDNGISGTVTNTFEDLATGNTTGFYTQAGASYGERFAGQTVTASGGFDVISGTPTSLTLLANASRASNIGILNFASNVLYGDLNGAVGEGAVSILLNSGTNVFGFNALGTNGGSVLAQFFAADGQLIDAITFSVSDQFYGFRATSNDVIRGVSLTNRDPGGMAFDNIKFNQNVTEVPEPGTLALFGLGLLAASRMRRRKS